MSLTAVKITEDAYLTCLTHALSTETEEIMGLLFGEIEYSNNGSVTALVWSVAPQTRSDRRKDRVETNPEQLAAAASQAEKISVEIGRNTRVIGWYHSHPHITVMPSHVDVRTQRMYQMLDSGFVGLIFSCFNEDGIKGGRIQVIAFQSLDGKSARDAAWRAPQQQSSWPSAGSPNTVIGIPVAQPVLGTIILGGESSSSDVEGKDHSVGTAFTGSGKQSQALELQQLFTMSDNAAGGTHAKLKGVSSEEDSAELSGSLQEAMLLSNYEYSGADYIRKEIPLEVVPVHTLLKASSLRSPLVDLQRILFTEEQAAYKQALMNCSRNGQMHPLAAVHHSAMYQTSLSKLLEYCLSTVLTSLMDKQHQNKVRMARLQEEIDEFQLSLKATTASGREPSFASSRGTTAGQTRGRAESDVFSPGRSARHGSHSVHAALQERKDRRSSVSDADLINL